MKFISPGSLGDLPIENEGWRNTPDFFAESVWTGNFHNGMFDNLLKQYGGKLEKRFHPAVPYVAVSRYTKKGEWVWDPFAGRGTTFDVCQMLGRNCIATDLHPVNENIQEADASLWNPGAETIDLIVAQPPYVNMSNYESPMSDTNDKDVFKQLFADCLLQMDKALKPGHMMVFSAGDIVLGDGLEPVEYMLHEVMGRFLNRYRLIARVVVDFYVGSRSNYFKYKKYSLLKNGRFMIGRDTIMFYQKCGGL